MLFGQRWDSTQSQPASLCTSCSLFPEQVTPQLGAGSFPCSEQLCASHPVLRNSPWAGDGARCKEGNEGQREAGESFAAAGECGGASAMSVQDSPRPEDLPRARQTAQVPEPAWRSDAARSRKMGGPTAEHQQKCLPAAAACPGTRVLSAEVPPSSCRGLEELSLTRLPACTWWAGEKPAHKQTSIFFTCLGIPVRRLAQKGIWPQCPCVRLGAELGVFWARTGCRLFISPVLGALVVGFQMTSAAVHL